MTNMNNIATFFLFFVVVIAGFYMVPLLANFAIMFGVFPETASFQFWFGGMSMWVWLGAILTAIGSFFTTNLKRKYTLMLAPVYAPALFGASVLIYFNFV